MKDKRTIDVVIEAGIYSFRLAMILANEISTHKYIVISEINKINSNDSIIENMLLNDKLYILTSDKLEAINYITTILLNAEKLDVDINLTILDGDVGIDYVNCLVNELISPSYRDMTNRIMKERTFSGYDLLGIVTQLRNANIPMIRYLKYNEVKSADANLTNLSALMKYILSELIQGVE